MKNCKILAVSLFLAALVCGFGYAAPAKAIVQTEIESFDKHGNANLKIKGNVFSVKGFGMSDIVSIKAGDFKYTAPLCRNYSDVDSGQYLLRVNGDEVSLAINLGNFQEESKTKVGSPVVITMKEPHGYLLTYQKRVLKKSTEREDFDSDEIFANFRELRGGKIAAKRVYRSSNPSIDETRAPYAARLIENAGVTAVLDISNSEEVALPFIQNNPYYKKLYDDGKIVFLDMEASFNNDSFSKKLQKGLKFIISHPNDTFVMHGKEGRNRTGFVAAVLEGLCGATETEIVDDFMESYQNLNKTKKNTSQYAELEQLILRSLENVCGKKLTDKNREAAIEEYLVKKVGLNKTEIESLKKILEK